MTVIEGVDYAFSRPNPAALVAAGKRFVVRYVSGLRPDGTHSDKDLTNPELGALRKAGLNVCLVWETSGGAAKRGRAQGVADAREAKREAATLGMSGVPIYFAVDFDAQGSTLTAAVEYVKGAAAVLGPDLTGVYGGYRVIEAVVNAKACRWLWQTYAWSAGKWHPAAQLQQYHNGQTIGGGALDLCRATVPDYGQFPRPGAGLVDIIKPVVKAAALVYPLPSQSAYLVNRALVAEKALPADKARGYWSLAAWAAFRSWRVAHGFGTNTRAALVALGAKHGWTVT